MKLSLRLQAVYDLLENDISLADIGCDHGLLAIEYAKNNSCVCFAIDNKKGPLDCCKKNIESENLQNKLIAKLSSGIDELDYSVNQLSICGMGGSNIVDILSNKEKLKNIKYIVAEPNNNSYALRKHLNKLMYKIVKEEFVEENEVIYEIIKFKKGFQLLNIKDLYFGPRLRRNKNKLFCKKYQDYLKYLKSLVKDIPDNIDNKNKIKRFKKEIRLIESEL